MKTLFIQCDPSDLPGIIGGVPKPLAKVNHSISPHNASDAWMQSLLEEHTPKKCTASDAQRVIEKIVEEDGALQVACSFESTTLCYLISQRQA